MKIKSKVRAGGLRINHNETRASTPASLIPFLRRLAWSVVLVSALPAFGQPGSPQPVEPKAGTWKTWAISSGKDFRVPPPPNAAATKDELAFVRALIAEKDPGIADQVKFWDAGPPSYRWMDVITNRVLAGANVTPYAHRLYAYVAMAMYDATVAAWDSKYAYNRPRPSEADPTLTPRMPVPHSPSYPSEHSATAAAAAAVLAYFFPDEAANFQSMAQEDGMSRVYAGVQYLSDHTAGLELGQKVAARVIELAKADGSDAVWTGTVPTGKCMWIGTNPGNVTATGWKPFLLTSPGEFRPPIPPVCDSAEMAPVIAEVRDFPRTNTAFATNQKAMYWQSPEGLNFWPYTLVNRWMFEDKLDQNPPRAARVYGLLAISHFDVFIASQDGKFAYWYIRPPQLETSIVPLFPTPNFPSYPSNHSSFSANRAEVLAYLFPLHADEARAIGKEAGDSRIWAGIHYQIDNQAGVALGRSVAGKFIAWAKADGSQ